MTTGHVRNIYGHPLYEIVTDFGTMVATLPHIARCGYDTDNAIPHVDTIGPFVN